MLRIDQLGKRYGDHLVFEGLTHRFGPGCLALCEEDSTGKSTLLGILAAAIAPDAGEVWVDGLPLHGAGEGGRRRLAYVPDDCLTEPQQTGRGLLEQVAHDKGVALDEAAFELAEALGLMPHLDKRFEQMSTGTRRKVYLTAAQLGAPALVVADGPSNGLDAAARSVLAGVFREWGRDRVVIFASHDAALVEACGARRIEVGALR